LNSALLDTSFLITLANPARPQHETAKRYLRECIQRQIPLYLSTIVVSEFQVRQSINDLQRMGKVQAQGTVGGGLDLTIGLRENGFIGVLLSRHTLPVVEVTHFHWPAR